jgi:hypothetical protein
MKRIAKPKSMGGKFWGYFSPDGYLQVRSISETKSLSREMLAYNSIKTWEDYEEAGYILRRINVDISVIN